jgi:hypothetical protein
MAKFQLADGESELVKELVEGVRDGKRVTNSRVIVTDRRIVLLVPKPDWFSRLFGMLFGRFAAKMAADPVMTHEIRRADFAEVEHEGKMLVFHSKGEGYAHVSFEAYATSSAEIWQQRMRDWAAGKSIT